MAPTSHCVVIFTCITGILAQERRLQEPLQHGNPLSADCFDNCWKTAGSCLWCGGGNACCNIDGSSSAEMCTGVSFPGMLGMTGHRCVATTHLPGQNSPRFSGAPVSAPISSNDMAQCTAYEAETGCGWTNEYSCPGQPAGSATIGKATEKTTLGYKCCCENRLWRESAQPQNRGGNNPLIDQAQCQNYYSTDTCAWTAEWNCPGQQTAGRKGPASDDGSDGYNCCCRNGGWNNVATTSSVLNGNVPDPNAFNVESDNGMTDNAGGNPLLHNQQDDGFQMNVAAGQQSGNNVRANGNGEFLLDHQGPNSHMHTWKSTDTNFVPTAHHGPIHNKFSDNGHAARKERCVAGVCAPLLSSSHPDQSDQPETQMGQPVLMATENKPAVLPSIEMSMGDGDTAPHMMTPVTGAVSTVVSPVAVSGVVAPPAAPGAVVPAAGAVVPAAPAAPAAPPVFSARTVAAPPVPLAKAAPAPVTAEPTLQTTLADPVVAGATVLAVADAAGFMVGDQILVGNTETKTVVATNATAAAPPTARRLNATGATITISPAMSAAYAAGAPIQRIPPQQPTTGPEGSSATSSGSSSLSTSSAGYGWLVCLVLVCCICLAGGGAAAFVMMNKNKKKRSTTDREAYLKNDFIERQPVYHEVPESAQEVEPMMREKDQGFPMADVNNEQLYSVPPLTAMQNPLEPTQSFPIQVELAQPHYAQPQTVAPVTQASGISFPGLPTIGGGGGSLLQQTFAAPSTAQYFGAQPQAASMNATMPYGNYTSQSQYVQQPSGYSQSQLGMTTSLQNYPGAYAGGGVV